MMARSILGGVDLGACENIPLSDLGITEGDQIVFRLEQHRALLAKTPNLLDLAGTVEVPAAKRGVAWDEVRRSTRRTRAEARR